MPGLSVSRAVETDAMIYRETAQEGIIVLSTAIGMLMEEASAAAIDLRPLVTAGDGLTRFRALKSVGEDIAALAEAVGVLVRHSGT